MDLRQGLHPIVRYNVVAQLRPGKLLGLLFGCLVVGIMLFMMFAILGGLFAGNE
jgi:tetrahydromethanopterin S-methyltransferase subunit G